MPAQAKSFFTLVARDLMNGEVLTIPRDLGMQAAARWLSQRHVSGAPVVDEEGRCVGVLSSHDFIACCAAHRMPCTTYRAETVHGACTCSDSLACEWQMVNIVENSEDLVRDHMTPNPMTARPDTPITQLAQMMRNAHAHRLIIVDDQRRPLGIVSSADVVAAVARAEQNG